MFRNLGVIEPNTTNSSTMITSRNHSQRTNSLRSLRMGRRPLSVGRGVLRFGCEPFAPRLFHRAPADERVGHHDDDQQDAGDGIVIIRGEAHEHQHAVDGGHDGREYK